MKLFEHGGGLRQQLLMLAVPVGAGILLGGLLMLVSPREAYAIDENQCLTCHGNPGFNKTTKDGQKISLFVNELAANTSAHRYIDCATCHTDKPHEVTTPLTKQSLAEKCGSCHKYEYQQHLQSVHGQELSKGNSDVATCTDCHSPDGNPHNVIRTLEYSAPAYKKNIAQTCAQCHNNEELMSSYGIVEKTYESYMRSFHGKAMQLGTYEITQLDEATCTNCHGTHDIKSINDPTSPVNGLDNLAQTCEQCHQGAGVNFARGFLGHKEASPQNIPVAHYSELFFKILTTSVLGFGAVVVVAAVVRFSANKWRK